MAEKRISHKQHQTQCFEFRRYSVNTCGRNEKIKERKKKGWRN